MRAQQFLYLIAQLGIVVAAITFQKRCAHSPATQGFGEELLRRFQRSDGMVASQPYYSVPANPFLIRTAPKSISAEKPSNEQRALIGASDRSSASNRGILTKSIDDKPR